MLKFNFWEPVSKNPLIISNCRYLTLSIYLEKIHVIKLTASNKLQTKLLNNTNHV